MRPPIRSRAFVGFVAGAAALLLIPLTLGGAYYLMQLEFAEVRELRRTTEETLVTREQLSRLLIVHLDAETSVRGYVISENATFLEPYRAGIGQRNALFEKLETNLEPALLPQLRVLRSLSDLRMSNLEANIRDVDDGRPRDAQRRTSSGGGKRIMDEIRSRIAALDAFELKKMQQLTVAGDGSRNDVERSVNGLMIALGLLLLFVSTVTARSMASRRKALARSRRLSERQKAMFEGAVDPMLLLDAEGNILRMNPSVSRLFGYSEDDLLGKNNMVLMADEYSSEQSRAWLMSVREAGAHGAGKRQEFTGLRKDGSTFETEIAISRFVSGEERQYIAAIRDITDRKRAEQMKTEFVSTVSHELRTPLTSIGGSLGLLAAGAVGPLEDKAKRLVMIAHSNCERLIRLINDILDIEKIESGKMEFDLRRMQVAPLIRQTTSALTGFAERHGVNLAVELPPWPQCIDGDPDRLEQLLTNLVSNAIKHSPEDGTVELATNHDGGNIRIEVSDRGAGVPLGFRERIFAKFAMADASDSRTKGGTGLGLSIAREIARRHGGDIGFVDREGGGTTFFVTLPVAKDEPTVRRGEGARQGLLQVLHVDDDLDCLNVVASAFGDRANLISAGSLPQAMELAASEVFDVAIIDVDMRSEDGLGLVSPLRERNPGIQIVLFTAMDEPYFKNVADKVLIKSRSSIDNLVETVLAMREKSNREVA